MSNSNESRPPDALPDSHELNGTCPRCGRWSNFSVTGSLPVTYNGSSYGISSVTGKPLLESDERVTALTCAGCGQNTIVFEEVYIGGVARSSGMAASGVVTFRGMQWWPAPGSLAGNPDIPKPVADAMAEGARCLAARAPRAAVVMFRGSLAEMVADRGSPAAQGKNSLAAQLKQMADDGALDATLADWADHVRVIGNAGAHPSTLSPVSMEEASELSRLLATIFDYLYVMPAKIQRARAARP